MPLRELESHLYTDLTEQQERILDFIEKRYEDGLPPPTRSEIAKRFKFRSINSAKCHLVALDKKGRIELLRGTPRGIKLVRP